MRDLQRNESQTYYKTKVIQWDEPDKSYGNSFMLTFIDPGNNPALSSAGFRGRYVIFTLLGVANRTSSYDPYKLEGITEELRDFFLNVRREWKQSERPNDVPDMLQDGTVIGPDSKVVQMYEQ